MREAVVATDGLAPPPPDGVPWTLGAEPVRNVGRLFLTVPPAEEGGKERKAYCSAAVVDSANRSVVVTAGHCVHLKSIPGGWVKKLLFVPAYDKGVNRTGVTSPSPSASPPPGPSVRTTGPTSPSSPSARTSRAGRSRT